MKRIYKIVLLFVTIFLVGVLFFAGYINYTLNKKDATRTTEVHKPTAPQKSTVTIIYF